jgi:excinuclease UvrABC ATPase subunit
LKTLSGFVKRDDFEGAVGMFDRLYINNETGGASEAKRDTLRRFVSIAHCPACDGTRLNEAARSCEIDGYNIADLAAMEVGELVEVVSGIEDPVAAPMVSGAAERLRNLMDIGLGYLSLDRETSTLSGGESQRIKMVRHLGSSLVDIMYIFDEPTTGLHMSDVGRLLGIMNRLVDGGNSVIVIEHNLDVVANADWVIDLGPEGGSKGGEIVFEGMPRQLLSARGSYTGEYLRRRSRHRPHPPSSSPTATYERYAAVSWQRNP